MGGGQNEINARHLQTEVGVEVEDELGNNKEPIEVQSAVLYTDLVQIIR